jgi:hypothetical protein
MRAAEQNRTHAFLAFMTKGPPALLPLLAILAFYTGKQVGAAYTNHGAWIIEHSEALCLDLRSRAAPLFFVPESQRRRIREEGCAKPWRDSLLSVMCAALPCSRSTEVATPSAS